MWTRTQHVFRNRRSQDVARELTAGLLGIDACSSLKNLQGADEEEFVVILRSTSTPPEARLDLNISHRGTCTTALEPFTSRTSPLLLVPSGRVRWTISAYLGNCSAKNSQHNRTGDDSRTRTAAFRDLFVSRSPAGRRNLHQAS